jgi:hypothetical protein
MAKRMLSGNKKLVSIGNATNILPVVMAIQFRHTALAGQLYSLTPPEDLMPENGVNGATLCTQAIYTRNLGKNSSSNNPSVVFSCDDLKSLLNCSMFSVCSWHKKNMQQILLGV